MLTRLIRNFSSNLKNFQGPSLTSDIESTLRRTIDAIHLKVTTNLIDYEESPADKIIKSFLTMLKQRSSLLTDQSLDKSLAIIDFLLQQVSL